MTAYRFTATFTTDRELSDDELADLILCIHVQLEEPATFNDEGTTDATYTTTGVVVEWPEEVEA